MVGDKAGTVSNNVSNGISTGLMVADGGASGNLGWVLERDEDDCR